MAPGDLADTARIVARLAMPVGLAEALEARRTFRRRGLRTPSLRICRQAWLSRLHLLPADLDLTSGLVLDVGANEGSFTNAILALAPGARVLAVEPAPGPQAQLRERFGADARVEVAAQALADRSGTATFHLTEHSHNSSLRTPRAEMTGLYEDEGWRVAGAIEVPVTTLDELVGERDVAVLKLDVQGGEREVLRGGAATLARTRAVLMEVTFVSHYEGDATFDGLHQEMVGLGFELISVSEPGRTAGGDVATWADACYARR
jgi:FkbM family methyltransferase